MVIFNDTNIENGDPVDIRNREYEMRTFYLMQKMIPFQRYLINNLILSYVILFNLFFFWYVSANSVHSICLQFSAIERKINDEKKMQNKRKHVLNNKNNCI